MTRPRHHHERFGAPMAMSIKVITLLAWIILVAVSVIPWLVDKPLPIIAVVAGPVLCLALLLITPLFAVRGFEIHRHELRIQRLLWQSRLSLKGLISAKADPHAMKGSIRLFGNGGFYAYTGLFRNRLLGNYRAYITDPSRCVILKFHHRTVVISPDQPETFVRCLGFGDEIPEDPS